MREETEHDLQAERAIDMETAPNGLAIAASDGVVRLQLDNGDENRVSPLMVSWMTDFFTSPPASCRVVVLTAAGSSFCLGPEPAGAPDRVRGLGESLARLNRAITGTRVVTVAGVDGDAAGFGVGLACLPDITIAGDNARLVLPEVEVGLSPALVLSWLGEMIAPKVASYMALTGLPIGSGRAQELGLVTRAVASEDLRDELESVVSRLGSFDPTCLGEVKRFLVDRRGIDLAGAQGLAIDRMAAWAER